MPEFKRVCLRFLAYRKVEGETPRLTLNEESDVGHPYAQRNRHNNSVFVPNSYARVIHESETGIRRIDDIHAKDD